MGRRNLVVATVTVASLGLAGCSTVSSTSSSSGSGSSAAKGPFTIGISNGFVGSEYRTQMVQDMQDAAKPYQDAGELKQLVLENQDTDVNYMVACSRPL